MPRKTSVSERLRTVEVPGNIAGTDGRISTAVVDDISPDGVARVTLSGDDRPREASTLLRFASSTEATAALLGSTVLVLANPDSMPVILGIVRDRVWDSRDTSEPAEAQLSLPAGQARSVQLDKRRLDLEASDEIRLTCGKSSLVMRRDGSVVVRGVTIVSRALQSNKIRGGTVSLN